MVVACDFLGSGAGCMPLAMCTCTHKINGKRDLSSVVDYVLKDEELSPRRKRPRRRNIHVCVNCKRVSGAEVGWHEMGCMVENLGMWAWR